MLFASVGVHARNAAIQAPDQQAVQISHVESVKLVVGGNEMGDIDAYRTAGVNSFHARLYTEELAHDGGMTAAKFVQVFTPAIQAYIAKGITAFEIHNEPNLTIEGVQRLLAQPATVCCVVSPDRARAAGAVRPYDPAGLSRPFARRSKRPAHRLRSRLFSRMPGCHRRRRFPMRPHLLAEPRRDGRHQRRVALPQGIPRKVPR